MQRQAGGEVCGARPATKHVTQHCKWLRLRALRALGCFMCSFFRILGLLGPLSSGLTCSLQFQLQSLFGAKRCRMAGDQVTLDFAERGGSKVAPWTRNTSNSQEMLGGKAKISLYRHRCDYIR